MLSSGLEIGLIWVFGGLFILFMCFVIVSSNREQRRFEERFPPISDDEFMARCPTGTNREIALKVRRIVADQCAIEYERIYPESSFMNDLNVG